MIIYKATNKTNGKIYIGQTINTLEQRKGAHIRYAKANPKTYFWRALIKYGTSNFKWEVICICPNIDSLNEQEEYYIFHYSSMDRAKGYNLTSGGEGYIVSEETKRKMSKVCREYWKNKREGLL